MFPLRTCLYVTGCQWVKQAGFRTDMQKIRIRMNEVDTDMIALRKMWAVLVAYWLRHIPSNCNSPVRLQQAWLSLHVIPSLCTYCPTISEPFGHVSAFRLMKRHNTFRRTFSTHSALMDQTNMQWNACWELTCMVSPSHQTYFNGTVQWTHTVPTTSLPCYPIRMSQG